MVGRVSILSTTVSWQRYPEITIFTTHDCLLQSWRHAMAMPSCASPARIFPNSVTRVVPGLSGRSCQPIRDETPSVTSLLAQQHGARQAIAAVGVMMRWLTTWSETRQGEEVLNRHVTGGNSGRSYMFSVLSLVKYGYIYSKREKFRAWGSNPPPSEL